MFSGICKSFLKSIVFMKLKPPSALAEMDEAGHGVQDSTQSQEPMADLRLTPYRP